jgi:hypothetical protein
MKKIAVLSFLLIMACSGRSGFFDESSHPYHRVLWDQTEQRRYHTLENVPYQTAITYKNEAFRRAYVKEYVEMYHLPPEKAASMLAEELAEASEFDVFVIAHFASQREAAQITSRPKVWRIVLTTDPKTDFGSEPISVSSLAQGTDPVLMHFYPYVTPWSSNYLVKFKKVSANPLYIRMSGVLADVIFRWKTS